MNMNYTLYHYVHCPFCLRVRMTFGYLGIAYTSIVLPYDDEKTPTDLTGKKMLPILKHDQGVINESLDIMQFIDKKDVLSIPNKRFSHEFKDFEFILAKLGNTIHSLAMPYWIFTPEFDENSRAYFKKKREVKRGPFQELLKNQKSFIQTVNMDLLEISKSLQPFYQSSTFGVFDIMLASHLWGLYVVPEFQFSSDIHQYLLKVKDLCHFNYHQDLWGKI